MTYVRPKLLILCRVKLPKTFLAVNLSDAFTFEEQERLANDHDMLEMKAVPPKDLLSGGHAPVADVDAAADTCVDPAPIADVDAAADTCVDSAERQETDSLM